MRLKGMYSKYGGKRLHNRNNSGIRLNYRSYKYVQKERYRKYRRIYGNE